MDILSDGLTQLGLNDARIKNACDAYLNELMLFNASAGLMGTKDRDEIIIRHILDSLAPWRIFRSETPPSGIIADAGSGAGFPGIPLALALPPYSFVLIEKKGRRAAFLQNVKAVLKLNNVVIDEREVEQSAKDGGRFDAITCRGFSEINGTVIALFTTLTRPGGALLFYKGKKTKIESELAASPKAPPFRIIPYTVPFLDEERHLAVLKTSAARNASL